MVVLAAAAFSSEKWLAERNDDSDVMRLREAWRACKARVDQKLEQPAENVTIPLETFPDGTVKSRVTAKRAHVFVDTGFVWGEGIRVEQYDEKGKVHASLVADDCIVDRKARTGWVAGAAKMVYGESSISGRGIYFSLTREFIKIFSQSEVCTGKSGFDPRSLTK